MGSKSSSQTVGHKYYMGAHFVLCAGPIDKIIEGRVADRVAWIGEEYGATDAYTQIVIDKPSLFGGKKREGGLKGTIDVGMGYPDQPINDYLKAKIGANVSTNTSEAWSGFMGSLVETILEVFSQEMTEEEAAQQLVPAYRGVVSLILRHFYIGNNPYPKPWKWLVSRIHVRGEDGDPQWYDEKSEVLTFSETVISASYDHDLDAALDDDVLSDGDSIPPPGSLIINTNPSDVVKITLPIGRAFVAWSPWSTNNMPSQGWKNRIAVSIDGSPYFNVENGGNENGNFDTQEEARAAFGEQTLTGGSQYAFFLEDTPIVDNRGGLSIHVEVESFVSSGDMNPAHIIREMLTDTVNGRALPETEIGPTYTAVADTLWNEGFGLTFKWVEETPIEEMIAEVIRHIDAVRYEDPDTLLQEIKLIRDDYDIETLPVLNRSNCKLEQLTDGSESELYNRVTIKYWDRAKRTWTSIPFEDTAAINQSGKVNNITIEYSGIARADVATMAGLRDLARFTRPFRKGRLVVNRTVANLKPGDPFVLEAPEEGVAQLVGRVAKRSESGLLNGEITIDFGEDIFGASYATYTAPTPPGWTDPVGTPRNFSRATAFEIPRHLLIEELGQTGINDLSDLASYYGFAGCRPNAGVHLNYELFVYPDGETVAPDSEFGETAEFTPFAMVSQDILDPLETVIPVSVLSATEYSHVGHLVLVGDATDGQRELIALDVEPVDGDVQITVKRGIADTVPREILAGTPLYFIDTFVGASTTEYLAGEVVEGYGAPRNGQGEYEGPFDYYDVEMAGRAFKPYPPANFKVDGISFPDPTYNPDSSQVELTWRHRDRLIQSDQVIAWGEDADYGPENLTTYRVEADAYDASGVLLQTNFFSQDVGLTGSYTFDLSANPPPVDTLSVTVRVWTVRDGEDSLQAVAASFVVEGHALIDGAGQAYLLTGQGDALLTGH